MIAQRPAAVLVAVLFAAACGSADVHEGADVNDAAADAPAAASSSAGVSASTGDPARARDATRAASGPSFVMGTDGGASMHTRNGAMVMSLRGDSIVVAFSDSVRQKVRRELSESMGKESAPESGLEQLIQGVVKSSVKGALGEVFDKSRGFPLSSLKGIEYERGAIRFDFVSRPTWSMEGFETDGTPLLEQFHPADAARFVGAVRARLAR
jgi:hypothetical protein